MRVLKCCSAVALAVLCALGPASAPVAAQPSPQPEDSYTFKRIGKCVGFLEGALPDGKGGLWMLDVEGGRILHADAGKDCVERARLDGFPAGAKFAPDGTITIVGRGGVHSFDPRDGKVERISASYDGAELTGLNDLSYDDHGGFYFTAPGNSELLKPDGRVFYRSPQGEITLIASGLAYPNGIAVAPDGNTVAVAEYGKNQIISVPTINTKSRIKMSYVLGRMSGGYGPDGIVYAPDGRLLIANFGAGALEVLEPRSGIRTFYLPPDAGTWITNVAVQDGTVVILEAEKGGIWQLAMPEPLPVE